MKNRVLFLLTALSLVFFSACNKDGDDGNFFRVNIDGDTKEANGLLAYGTYFSTSVSVYGVFNQTSGETCYITMSDDVTPGTYEVSNGDVAVYFVDADNKSFSTLWGNGSGSVTITEINDSRIKGSFSITAYDSDTENIKKELKEGAFNVAVR